VLWRFEISCIVHSLPLKESVAVADAIHDWHILNIVQVFTCAADRNERITVCSLALIGL
jgi:hypothetical protein